jgi:hypothetical protein
VTERIGGFLTELASADVGALYAESRLSAAAHREPDLHMPNRSADNDAYRFPVSVKGIVVRDGAVVLVRNRRDEWELPGGKLELNESPSGA